LLVVVMGMEEGFCDSAADLKKHLQLYQGPLQYGMATNMHLRSYNTTEDPHIPCSSRSRIQSRGRVAASVGRPVKKW
jgi:hypothetical protein